jgi:outer membrane protein assembly factor BamB
VRVVAAVLLLGACGRINFDPLADAAAVAGDDGLPHVPRLLAATMTEVYAIDTVTLQPTPVLPLCANLATVPTIADVAVARDGTLVLTTQGSLEILRTDATGACTSVPVTVLDLFGLDVVRGSTAATDTMIAAASSDDSLYRLDPATGALVLVGPMGQSPSGDIAWTGSELVMSADGGTGIPDNLAHVDLATGAATVRGTLPYDKMLGLAALDGTLYGFASTGQIVEVDVATGSKRRELATSFAWLGAGADLGP